MLIYQTRLFVYLVPIVLFLSACGDSVTSPDDETVTVDLRGQITDASTKEAIAGAEIKIDSWKGVSDKNGFYKIGNVPANSNGGFSKDYQAVVTLSNVVSPIDMTVPGTNPRYPERKFSRPASDNIASTSHNFEIGKLSASISGWTGDSDRVAIGGINVELQDNTPGQEGRVVQAVDSDANTGEFNFTQVEAGLEYILVAQSGDGLLQGSVEIDKLSDNELWVARLDGEDALLLTSEDTYSPRVVAVFPEDNSDVAPGPVNVVLTFNEPIFQDFYSIPNPQAGANNIYFDIDVSYGGQKASGNLAHTMSWNLANDELTIVIPQTGVSSRYSVDLSLLSPTGEGAERTLGKLKDLSGNGLEDSTVLGDGNLLTFSTNGGVLANAPDILSPNATLMDSISISVTIDWLPVTGAINGYNIYRSTRNNVNPNINEPFIKIAEFVAASVYVDTAAETGFSLLLNNEIAQYYVYRATAVNSDYIESAFSNELTIEDVTPPSVSGSSASQCVDPGGFSLITSTPNLVVDNGQLEITFSEALDEASAQNLSNYTGSNLSGATLNTPTTVVLDFSVPIICANTETIIVNGILDGAGNMISGSIAQRTITYVM